MKKGLSAVALFLGLIITVGIGVRACLDLPGRMAARTQHLRSLCGSVAPDIRHHLSDCWAGKDCQGGLGSSWLACPSPPDSVHGAYPF